MHADSVERGSGLRMLFAVILIISFTATILLFPPTIEVRLAAVAFLSLLSLPLCAWRNLDIFSPLSILAFSFYFYCFVGPLNLILDDKTYFYSVDVISQYGRLLFLAAVSAGGTLVGWSLGARRSKKASTSYSETTCLVAGGAYTALSLSAFVLYYFLSGTFVDRSRLLPEFDTRTEVVTLGYLLQGLDLCLPGLVLLCVSERASVRRLAYGLGGVLLIVALTTGFRANIVKTVFPLFMMGYVRTGRRPSAKVCITAGLCALLAFAGMGLVRSGGASFEEAFSSTALLERDLLLSDLNTIQAMSLVLAKVPAQAEYLFGSSITYVPKHVLPRSLFPEKGVAPEVQLVWDLTDKNAGFALPIFGLFYLNFGFAGAAGGMLVVGFISSRFYAAYSSNTGNKRLQAYLVVVSLLSYLVFPRHSLVQVLTQTVYSLAPLLLIDIIQYSPKLFREWRRTARGVGELERVHP